MTVKSDSTKIELILQEMGFIRGELKEVKANLTGGYVTMVQYRTEISALKKLVYWLLGLVASVLVALIVTFLGLVAAR